MNFTKVLAGAVGMFLISTNLLWSQSGFNRYTDPKSEQYHGEIARLTSQIEKVAKENFKTCRAMATGKLPAGKHKVHSPPAYQHGTACSRSVSLSFQPGNHYHQRRY